MDFADALYTGMTGYAKPDPDESFGSILGYLIMGAGSGAAAARQLGVSPTTLYRWKSGRQQPKMSVGVLAKALRRVRLPLEREQQIKRGELRMVVHGTVTRSKDVRPRRLDVGRYIPKRSIGNLVNAWLSGDDDKAERLFWRAMDKHYAADMEVQFTEITFERLE